MTSPHLLPDWWIGRNGWDFWAEYDAGDWEPYTRDRIEQFVTPGSTYVDIGAWIGPTVLWAAPLAGRVVAVEPDPVAFDLLGQNVAEHTNIELVNAAIGPFSGEALFAPHEEGYGSSMSRLVGGIRSQGPWNRSIEMTVDQWSLPDLFARYDVENVSLVKMDIEGGEADVLETACPFLAELGIPLLVSMHEDWWSHPVQASWFDCFNHIEGELRAYEPVLAIP